MKLEAARRLHKASLFTETEVVLRAVIQYMRDNGHEADYADDAHNTVLVNATMDDVIDTLDAHRFTIEDARLLDEGLYSSGEVVVMTGAHRKLQLRQVENNRIVISLGKDTVTAVSTSDEVNVPNTEMWKEDFNTEENQGAVGPGQEEIRSPGVNRIAQPNLNNSLMGAFKLEAVKRLLGKAK